MGDRFLEIWVSWGQLGLLKIAVSHGVHLYRVVELCPPGPLERQTKPLGTPYCQLGAPQSPNAQEQA